MEEQFVFLLVLGDAPAALDLGLAEKSKGQISPEPLPGQSIILFGQFTPQSFHYPRLPLTFAVPHLFDHAFRQYFGLIFN